MNPTKRIISGLMVCAMTMLLTGCDLFFDLIDNPINTTISMRTAELKLQIGQQETRTATSLSPATITYASSDPAVATVTQQGTVTALKEGTTRITASVEAVDYWTAASVSYLVTVVSGKKPVTSVTINKPSTSIVVGQTETLQVATITPDDATDKTIVWSSGDKTIATVDPATGLVTGVAAGTVSITATATQGTADTSDDVSAACEVTILSPVSYVRYDVSGTTATAVNDVALFGSYTELSNTSTDVTWTSGTYVVLSDVTISANVSLADGADVKLIICDGKELKVNSIEGKNATLTIYGQTASTGKLTANYANASIRKEAIWVRYLHVHGGDIIAKSNNLYALVVGDAVDYPYKYGYLNLYHGQISATGGVSPNGLGDSGMVISGDLTVYSGNIDVQGGAGTNSAEGGLFFFTQYDHYPQLNNYGGTIIAKGSDAYSQASPGIETFEKLSIVNDGTIKTTGGQSQNEIGGYGAYLQRGGSLSGTGTMEITGGDGDSGGYGLKIGYGCTFEYQSGKLTVLGGLKKNSTSRKSAIDGNFTNKSGASVTFQYTTDGTNWTNAPSATANNANFANSSSYKGVRVGY